MSNVSYLQTNFTAGEISPRLRGRTDIDKYKNAAAGMINAHPVAHGGGVRRGGTLFKGAALYSGASEARLVDFVVSRDEAYILEFGNLYMRVYSPVTGYTGVQLVSPYTAAQAEEIDYVQGADTMFLFHEDVPVQRLRNFGGGVWNLAAAPWTVEPFDEVGYTPAADLTLGATSGSGISATASASVFLPSDVGRSIISSAGIALVVGYTSGTVVTVNITTTFASVSQASGSWLLDVSPQGFLVPSTIEPTGTAATLSGALARAASITLTAKTGAITITASSSVFVPGDAGKVLYADSGIVTLAYSSGTVMTGTTTADFADTAYAAGAWGVTGDVFRSAVDVGKYIRVNGGLCKITAVSSPSKATALIVTALTSKVAAPPLAWSMEGPVWSAANGYPRTGTLHEQRLWCAGTRKFPQTIWGSRTGLYLDFTKGTVDTDACVFEIASDEINPISYLAAAREMLVHTYGGEFSLRGGTEKPITPTNVQIKPQSSHGSKGVRPLTIAKESIFVQRAGRKLLAIGYQFAVDGYVADDLTLLAEHITKEATGVGIVALAYQQEPDRIIWAVLGDGTLLSCTFDRAQGVTGWARHYTDGAVESVATVPNGDQDQTWLIVRRTVNGATVRYLETIDTAFAPQLPGAALTGYPPFEEVVTYGCTVDAGVVVDNAAGQSTFTGLGHLEGKAVDIVADGSAMPQQTVVGGQITIPRLSFRTLIGLHFDSRIKLLTPDAQLPNGTGQASPMRAGEVTMRFLNTLGAKVSNSEGGVQDVPFRRLGRDALDNVAEPISENVRINLLGWELGRSEVEIIQDQPLPMHLLSVVRKMTVNN